MCVCVCVCPAVRPLVCACRLCTHVYALLDVRTYVAALTYVLAKAAHAGGGHEGDANINDRSPMN